MFVVVGMHMIFFFSFRQTPLFPTIVSLSQESDIAREAKERVGPAVRRGGAELNELLTKVISTSIALLQCVCPLCVLQSTASLFLFFLCARGG